MNNLIAEKNTGEASGKNLPPARNCHELFKYHKKRGSGIFEISIGPHKSVQVYCDMDTDSDFGAGWTVVSLIGSVYVNYCAL